MCRGKMADAVRSIGLIVRLVFRADRRRALLSFLLVGLEALSGVINALWFKVIVDAAVSRDLNGALFGVAGLMGTVMVGNFSNWTSTITVQALKERVDWLIDQELIEISTGLPYMEHHERTDYLMEMELLRSQRGALSGTAQALVSNFSTLVQMVAVGILLLRLHPILLFLPIFAIPSLWIATRVERIRQRVQEETIEKSRTADHLFQLATTVGPAKELRIFGLQDEIPSRQRQLWLELDRIRHRTALTTAALGGLGWLIFSIGFVGAIVLVVMRAVQAQATPGDVILAVQLTGQVNQQVANAVSGISNLIQGLKTVGRYRWLLDYAHEISQRFDSTDTIPVPERIAQGIEMRSVSFTYPGTSAEVLKDVTLTLPAGSTVALVGENGAGKTTLVKLLCRFYDPSAGTITLDGNSLSRFDVEEWRKKIATAFQDFVQFEFVARETVGVGDLPRIEDLPAVEHALARAGAGDLSATFSSGLETQLGKTFEGGTELSGGQWQKLALGRSMMRTDPLLLILDEPTANLDAEAEHALFEGYARAARGSAENNGAITLLVSHRFSTVRMADLIVVLDGGRAVESGSHQDLLANGGLYAELFNLQAHRYR